jgi:uncharacterized cupredoxin-like copper-binding protein
VSDTLTLVIQQAQHLTFTINTSNPVIVAGQSVTISGKLNAPGSSSGLAATSVTLWAHPQGGRTFSPVGSTLTGSDGGYSFSENPTGNEVYQARTTSTTPSRMTAQLFEGVTKTATTTTETATTATTTTATTTTSRSSGTVVTVTADESASFTFTLSTSTQPKVVSDMPGAAELNVLAGKVTFNVTDSVSAINSHTFEVCSAPLPGPVKTLPALQKLPNSCTGTTVPAKGALAPSASATLTIDITTPGTYEYLSPYGGPTGDAAAGMKGVLNVT